MNLACSICRGACCESIQIPPTGNQDVDRWIALHGPESHRFAGTVLECKCRALVDGKCSIYSQRPQVCQVYTVGSPECQRTVARRRTPEQAKKILALMAEQR